MTRRHPILIPGLILLALALVAGGFLLDAPVEKSVLLSNGGHWHRGACVNALSRYGDWPELMVFGGIGYLLARRARSVKWQRLLISAMIASTLSGMAVNASRLTTGRTRPRAEAPQGWYGLHHDGRCLIGRADFNSFPSGHTATAVGFAGVLLFGAPAWGAVAAAAAMAVAVSRILLGAHHPSDVIAATVLALIVAWAVWEYLGKRGRVDFGKQEAASRWEV